MNEKVLHRHSSRSNSLNLQLHPDKEARSMGGFVFVAAQQAAIDPAPTPELASLPVGYGTIITSLRGCIPCALTRSG